MLEILRQNVLAEIVRIEYMKSVAILKVVSLPNSRHSYSQ